MGCTQANTFIIRALPLVVIVENKTEVEQVRTPEETGEGSYNRAEKKTTPQPLRVKRVIQINHDRVDRRGRKPRLQTAPLREKSANKSRSRRKKLYTFGTVLAKLFLNTV